MSDLLTHSKNLVRLCLLAQEAVEQYSRDHGVDTSSARFELLSLQHDAAFVEGVLTLYSSGRTSLLGDMSEPTRTLLESITVAEAEVALLQNSAPEPFRLRSLRRNISKSTKSLVDRLRTSPVTSPDNRDPAYADPIASGVFLRFFQAPFAVQGEQFSAAKSPDGLWSQYAGPMEKAASEWLGQVNIDQSSLTALKTQKLLLEQLWIKTAERIRDSPMGWTTEQSEDKLRFETLQDQLDQGIRDALARELSPHRMVFVSTENSGKSTFLNGLVGQSILPTGPGLVTALPCRIIHSVGLTTPELHIDAGYWNSKLQALRSIDGKQDFPAFRKFAKDLEHPLLKFEKTDFSFMPMSMGDVQETLGQLNYLVRLLDIFSIPFMLFASESWAVIRVEFETLKQVSANGHYELVDIPGIPEDSTEFHWNELVMEVMRDASAIVAIVSAPQYPFRPWHLLPGLIASGTNIRATAVVITMTDLVDVAWEDDDEWKQSMDDIKHVFWPESMADPSDAGLVLSCSAAVGLSLQALRSTLRELNTKPQLSVLWTGPGKRAMDMMYKSKSSFERSYNADYTLEDLHKDLDHFQIVAGYESTIATLNAHLTGAARLQYHDEVAKGIDLRVRRLLSMTNAQAIALGLAPRDLSKIKSRHEALKREGADLLGQWSKQQGVDYQAVDESIRSAASAACDQVIQSDIRSGQEHPAQYLDYDTVQEIETFVTTTQSTLYSSLVDLQTSVAKEAIAAAHGSLTNRLQPIIYRISDFDPQAEAKLTILLRNSMVPGDFAEPPRTVLDITQLTSGPSQPNRREFSFRTTQERVLQGFSSRKQNDGRKIEELPILTRLLLATISFIPFALKLPFHAREARSRPFQYRLDLDRLRRTYKDIIAQPWTDQTSRDLQSWLHTNESEAHTILENAITAGINASERRLLEMSKLHTTSDASALTGITDNYCNLVAADSALRAVIALRKPAGHAP